MSDDAAIVAKQVVRGYDVAALYGQTAPRRTRCREAGVLAPGGPAPGTRTGQQGRGVIMLLQLPGKQQALAKPL